VRAPLSDHEAMAPRRALRATPSNASELSQFQLKLLSDLRVLDAELLEKRIPIITVAQEYAKMCGERPEQVLNHVASVREHLSGGSRADAMAWAQDLLKPELANSKVTGVRETCIVQWRFDDNSMWRGVPDNPRVVKLAKSIINTRFRKDSVIASRTLDMSLPADAKDPKLRVVPRRVAWEHDMTRGVSAAPSTFVLSPHPGTGHRVPLVVRRWECPRCRRDGCVGSHREEHGRPQRRPRRRGHGPKCP